jgi:hypothetical protein
VALFVNFVASPTKSKNRLLEFYESNSIPCSEILAKRAQNQENY